MAATPNMKTTTISRAATSRATATGAGGYEDLEVDEDGLVVHQQRLGRAQLAPGRDALAPRPHAPAPAAAGAGAPAAAGAGAGGERAVDGDLFDLRRGVVHGEGHGVPAPVADQVATQELPGSHHDG